MWRWPAPGATSLRPLTQRQGSRDCAAGHPARRARGPAAEPAAPFTMLRISRWWEGVSSRVGPSQPPSPGGLWAASSPHPAVSPMPALVHGRLSRGHLVGGEGPEAREGLTHHPGCLQAEAGGRWCPHARPRPPARKAQQPASAACPRGRGSHILPRPQHLRSAGWAQLLLTPTWHPRHPSVLGFHAPPTWSPQSE